MMKMNLQKINYQKELEKLIDQAQKADKTGKGRKSTNSFIT